MRLKILGAHNTESLSTRLACALLDGVVALDAGAITSTLTLAQQQNIKHVLITHRHYDHIRDLLTLGINARSSGLTLVYSIDEVIKSIRAFYINGELYPDFTKDSGVPPKFMLTSVKPKESFRLLDYEVTPLEVRHSVPSVGYLVDKGGTTFFFSGDCGEGLAETLAGRRIDLLITEVTYGDAQMSRAAAQGHMTPAILAGQLLEMSPRPGRVIVMHMDPMLEVQIKQELAVFKKTTGIDLTLGREGQEVRL